MTRPRLVVIAASAGGLPAMLKVLAALPADFPAAIAIVQHRSSEAPEQLIEILSRHTHLRVQHAETGMILEAGTVYVCPPGLHMTAEHALRLFDGPRVDFVRPNADLMFGSVARAFGPAAIAVVLSGSGHDAALGSLAIAQAGGTVLAQDPATCSFAGMPNASVQVGAATAELSPEHIARELARLVTGREVLAPPAPGTIQVVLADDHRIVLDGLRVLLDSEPDVHVVAGAEDGDAVIRASIELSPDIVVMDIRMPGVDGIESTKRILEARPDVGVIALSAENDPLTIDRMLRAGAAGYLTKHRAFEDLVSAVRGVAGGKSYLSPEVARLVANGRVAAPRPRSTRAR